MQFLQQYFWFIVVVLLAIFIVSLYTLVKCHKSGECKKSWMLSFFLLFFFMGCFVSSFPIFFSVFVGGAVYFWLLFLITMTGVVCLSIHSIDKLNTVRNVLCNVFIYLVGIFVGTMCFGAEFTVAKENVVIQSSNFTIVSWVSGWKGLELLVTPSRIVTALMILFFARMLASINGEGKSVNKVDATLFIVFFVVFSIIFLTHSGVKSFYSFDEGENFHERILVKDNLYWYNIVNNLWLMVLYVVSILALGYEIFVMFKSKIVNRCNFVITLAAGTLFFCALFFTLNVGHTSFLSSVSNIKSSLTVSSSSYYESMSLMLYSSFLLPFALAYLIWVLRRVLKK